MTGQKSQDGICILPHDNDIERSILASLLVSPDTVVKIFEILTPKDFYETRHQLIFREAQAMHIDGKPCELTALVPRLREVGELEKSGGATYIASLQDFPVPKDVDYYCRELQDLSELRVLVMGANEIVHQASNGRNEIDSVRKKIETLACRVGERKSKLVPTREDLTISDEDWTGARLSPRCVVQDYLYADVAILVAPGGTGKTTITSYEAIHIVLGKRLYGLNIVNRGWCLFITAEDSREIVIARTREVADGLGLSDEELAAVRKGIMVWDVSGEAVKLIGLDAGNIVLTEIADQIVRAFRDDPPAIVTFDPAISFGVSEGRINDNEQGLITAARRIRNGLGCAVRLVHHTGQAAAREKTLDQYTSRGGTALPDGSRMAAVLQPWSPHDQIHRPPQGCAPDPRSSITILARPKLSYSKPNLPLIWIKRTGWHFECFTEIVVSDEERDRARLGQVESFLASQESLGTFHSKNSLEGKSNSMGLTRRELRDALAQLMAEGRVIEKELPKDRRQGGKKTFLSAPQKRRGSAKLAETGKTTSPGINHSTTSPPLRKKIGGEVAPSIISSVPRLRREDSARFGEVGEVEPKRDHWEAEI